MESKTHTTAFISYSRKDYLDESGNILSESPVAAIKAALDKAGIDYWFDMEGMHYGDGFAEKILVNLQNSDILVFLSTKNANASMWTRKEIMSAIKLGKEIVPVRVDNSEYDPSVSLLLSDLNYIEYWKDPKESTRKLVSTIVSRAEEKKRAEQEKLREEQDKQIIREIKLGLSQLEEDFARAKKNRDKLIIKANEVDNPSERDLLLERISFALSEDEDERKTLERENKALKKENDKLLSIIKQTNSDPENTSNLIRSKDPKDNKSKEIVGQPIEWMAGKESSIMLAPPGVVVFVLFLSSLLIFMGGVLEAPGLFLFGIILTIAFIFGLLAFRSAIEVVERTDLASRIYMGKNGLYGIVTKSGYFAGGFDMAKRVDADNVLLYRGTGVFLFNAKRKRVINLKLPFESITLEGDMFRCVRNGRVLWYTKEGFLKT